ncbi:MAG: ISL3 family transposase [bacterium]|nr:ISL3 family transposase [bacterium]
MTLEMFYQKLLNPPKPWVVSKVELSEDGSRVDVWLTHEQYTFLCSVCQEPAPTYDHMPERIFQHLDTCESKTFLHVRLPRVNCPKHGVKQGVFPLAGPYLDVTYKMEAKCIQVMEASDRSAASDITGVSWERLGGIMKRAVDRGLERRGDAIPRILGMDEKQVFSRHRYVTIITDPLNHSVYDVITDGRAMKDITHWFEEHKDKLIDVEKAAMDMSASYGSLAVIYMPNAEICYDHYHVIATMNKAVDEVRKSAQAKIVNEEDRRMFFRSRMMFLYGEENLADHLRFKFEKAKSISAPTARAWEIKELLRGLWRVTPEEAELAAYFKKWFWRATHSRLEPIRKAAKTLKRHWAGILAAIMNGISNSATEGLNSKIEVIKRSACGYRNKDNFRTAILFHCGKLDLMPEMGRRLGNI